MKTPLKILIVIALAACVAGAVALKQSKAPSQAPPSATAAVASESTGGRLDQAPPAPAGAPARPAAAAKLPRLVDLGAGKCIPCKMMKPILDDLKANYADRFTTEFIDVWENPDAGRKYGIEMIPTQIFYDTEGKELFRHVGFFGQEDILGKWKELGVDESAPSSAAGN